MNLQLCGDLSFCRFPSSNTRLLLFYVHGKGLLYLCLSDYLSSVPLTLLSMTADISAVIVQYITNNITEAITLDAIARELSYAPSYPSGRTQDIFGMSLCSLIASIRADKAKIFCLKATRRGLRV